MLSSTPLATPASTPADFETMLTRASGQRQNKSYALDHGIDELALVGYVTGALSVYERTAVESIIARCKWAHEFVLAYFRSWMWKEQKGAA